MIERKEREDFEKIQLFYTPEYQLTVSLREKQSINLNLIFFNPLDCRRKQLTQIITYDSLNEEQQFLFETIDQMFSVCFCSPKNILVEQNFVYILYGLETKKTFERKLTKREIYTQINQFKGIDQQQQVKQFQYIKGYEKDERMFQIVLHHKEEVQTTMIRAWIRNIKLQYITIKRDKINATKIQILKQMTFQGHSFLKRKQWSSFINQIKTVDPKSYQRWNKIQIPFQLKSILKINTNILSIMANCRQRWLLIKEINLNDCQVGVQQMRCLGQLQLPNLLFLELNNNQITDEGLSHLSASNFSKLEEISLNKNEITDKGIQNLFKSNFQNLQKLYLNRNLITNEGVKYLCEVNLPHLSTLCLNNNRISPKGVQLLFASYFHKLNILRLGNNSHTSDDKLCVRNLSGANFPYLKEIGLDKFILSQRQKLILKQKFANVTILY